jgi:DNA-binding MarR family transcriptional regulator
VSPHARLPFDPIAEAERKWADHGWESAARGMAAVISTIRAERIFYARIYEALQPLDLTFARYEVLMMLLFSKHGSLPLGKIAVRMRVKSGSVTNACDHLERQGFARRVPHPIDGRTILAAITPAGRKIAQDATERLNEALFASTGMSDGDLDEVFDIFRRLRLSAGDFDA